MNAGGPHSGSAVFGEVKDLSIGGAQVWLPERFSLFSKMKVLMRIGGLDFQGRAEVVGAEVHPTGEGYRHSRRWLGLSNHAKATLSQADCSQLTYRFYLEPFTNTKARAA